MRIKYLRESRKWTQGDLAKKLGISTANVSKYELAQLEPNLTVLKKLSEIFDVSIDYIVGITDNPSKTENRISDNETEQADYVYIMGSDGTRRKIYVSPEKSDRLKKLLEAGFPEIFED